MRNLIHMDLYRMGKSLSFKICLGLALLFGLAQAPVARLLDVLSSAMGENASFFAKEITLSDILRDPFPLVNSMLVLLSVCTFYYADQENGYIKNIAGQMPKRGFTILSKYLASIVHTLLFAVAGIMGNLIGNLVSRHVVFDGAILDGLLVCLLRLLLVQGICAILLLATAGFRSKSLGTVLSVLLGTGIMSVIYMGLEAGLQQVPFLKGLSFSPYMPDQLLQSVSPDPLTSLASAAVCIGLFLPLSIRVLDRRDIK